MNTQPKRNNKQFLSGIISALPTPFFRGQVDYESLERLVHFQIKNGIGGFVVNGTTAESPTLSSDEVEKIFQTVKKISEDQRPIYLGTGSNSTEHTIHQTIQAAKMGADAALVVVPYYNKPSQRGLIKHFTAVADAAVDSVGGPGIPIVLYNVPSRTITSLSHDSILELSKVKNIVGIKEASGDLDFDQKLKNNLPQEFVFLSGDDSTYLPFLKMGGDGAISVMSNLIPAESARWTMDMRHPDKQSAAQADFKKYEELVRLMFVEANPVPLKWMLYKMGLFKSPELRLPLVELDEKFHAPILNQMKLLGIL